LAIHTSNVAAVSSGPAPAFCRALIHPADEILGKLSEAAARIVQFFGLLTAAREEDFVESGGAGRIGLQEKLDLDRNCLEAAYE
jgi:hypothetical protein